MPRAASLTAGRLVYWARHMGHALGAYGLMACSKGGECRMAAGSSATRLLGRLVWAGQAGQAGNALQNCSTVAPHHMPTLCRHQKQNTWPQALFTAGLYAKSRQVGQRQSSRSSMARAEPRCLHYWIALALGSCCRLHYGQRASSNRDGQAGGGGVCRAEDNLAERQLRRVIPEGQTAQASFKAPRTWDLRPGLQA